MPSSRPFRKKQFGLLQNRLRGLLLLVRGIAHRACAWVDEIGDYRIDRVFSCAGSPLVVNRHKMSSQSKSNGSSAVAFGEWLRQLREQKGELLREVAAAAEMDLAHLSKIELGQRTPTEEQTLKLAKFFGVPANEMQARWIAERFRSNFGDYPAAQEAIEILAEEAGIYRAKRSR